MNASYEIRNAKEDDLQLIQTLLRENNQKPSVVINKHSIFLIAQSGDHTIGVIGAELNTNAALIRSAAVLPPWRNKGVGKILVETLLMELKEIGKRNIYLFSRDSGIYWQKYGFENCSVQKIIDALPDAPQVKGYINDNSIWTDIAWYKSLE